MCSLYVKAMALSMLLALPVADSFADSFRCGRKLVSVGDSAGELARVCGQPRHKDRGKESIQIKGVPKEASVQRWYYKKNSRSLEHIIVVYQGKVAAVRVGSR